MEQTTGPRRSGRVRKPVVSYADEQAADELARSAPPLKRTKKAPVSEAVEYEHSEFEIQVEGFVPEVDGDEHGEEGVQVKLEESDAEVVKFTTKTSMKPASIEPKAKATKRSKGKAKAVPTLNPDLPRPPGEKRPPAMYELSKLTRQTTAKIVATRPAMQALAKTFVRRLHPGEDEARLKPFVSDPPDSYYKFLDRANTHRMVVLERTRSVEESCHANNTDCPCETVQIAGSKGNVYTVEISHTLTCNCPEAIYRKSTCKHVVYILHQVLKAPEHLRYQDAFLTTELREIFNKAPPLPSETADDTAKDGNRKPITDDCPICFTEMEPRDAEGIVWCRAACGNNIHKACFAGWEKAKAGHVTCPFCRSAWDYGGFVGKRVVSMQTAVGMSMERGRDGYFNLGRQLGYV